MNLLKSKPGSCHKIICVMAFIASVTIALLALVALGYLCFDDPDKLETSKETLNKKETPLNRLSKEIESARGDECPFEEWRNSSFLQSYIKEMMTVCITKQKRRIVRTTWNDDPNQQEFVQQLSKRIRASDLCIEKSQYIPDDSKFHPKQCGQNWHNITEIPSKITEIEDRFDALQKKFFDLTGTQPPQDPKRFYLETYRLNERFKAGDRDKIIQCEIIKAAKDNYSMIDGMGDWYSGTLQYILQTFEDHGLHYVEVKIHEIMKEVFTLVSLTQILIYTKAGRSEHKRDLALLAMRLLGLYDILLFLPKQYLEIVAPIMRDTGGANEFLQVHHDFHFVSRYEANYSE